MSRKGADMDFVTFSQVQKDQFTELFLQQQRNNQDFAKLIRRQQNNQEFVRLILDNSFKRIEELTGVVPQKVGVFVDYEEGQVSFYNVKTRSHIYSFTGCTFTEKLYPFFSPEQNTGGENSAPLTITPVNLK